jgi:hypothetical protein
VNVRQRQPRIEDTAHLAYVRTLPCLICGKPGSDPAHIRSASREYGKRQTGMAEKPDDRWVLPLCRFHHDEQHRSNELEWWSGYGINPFAQAVDLYADRTKRERTRPPRKPRKRKPPGQRRSVGPSRPMQSQSRLPGNGDVKFPRKEKA